MTQENKAIRLERIHKAFGEKQVLKEQCHLDKDDAKNSVCRNMYPVLFLYNFIKHLTG